MCECITTYLCISRHFTENECLILPKKKNRAQVLFCIVCYFEHNECIQTTQIRVTYSNFACVVKLSILVGYLLISTQSGV